MKLLLAICLLNISIISLGQGKESTIQLKRIGKETLSYYSPNFFSEAYHSIEGLGNLRNPADSISSDKVLITGLIDPELEDSLYKKSLQATNAFTILVDTSLYIWKEIELAKPYRLNRMYTSYPGKLRIIRNERMVVSSIKRDMTVRVVAQPVFIANTSNELRYFMGYSGHILVGQQAKDKNGQWKDIEIPFPGGCSMTRYFCELKPNDFVLTTVYRFKGKFTTQLRIKLETMNGVFYSEPFLGSINYEQINNPQIRIIDDSPYERL